MSQSIIYTGPSEAVVTPDGVLFARGVPVPVSDDLAASLLLQSFVSAAAPALAPAPAAPADSFTAAPADSPAPAPASDPAPAPAVSVPTDPATPPVLAPVTGVTG